MIHMDRESLGDLPMGKYDVIVTITGYEQDRFITWEVSGEGFPSIGHYYGYRLEPVDGGTLVTSIYDWSNIGEQWKASGMWPIIPESALKATLGILERTVRPAPDRRRPRLGQTIRHGVGDVEDRTPAPSQGNAATVPTSSEEEP